MGLDTLIKRELAITALAIIFIVLGFFVFSYALFFDVDTAGDATLTFGDLELRFCEDTACTTELSTYANIIGTQTISGITSPTLLYPMNASTALSTTPYSFSIKNTGSLPGYVSLYLSQDPSYTLNSSYSNYNTVSSMDYDFINIAFGEVGSGNPTSQTFGDLIEGLVADNIYLEPNEKKTFNIWLWVDSSTTNTLQGTYFVVNVSAKTDFIPVSGT